MCHCQQANCFCHSARLTSLPKFDGCNYTVCGSGASLSWPTKYNWRSHCQTQQIYCVDMAKVMYILHGFQRLSQKSKSERHEFGALIHTSCRPWPAYMPHGRSTCWKRIPWKSPQLLLTSISVNWDLIRNAVKAITDLSVSIKPVK